MLTCCVCGSDFHVQARLVEYPCRVVTLCRLCSLRGVTDLIFTCTCGHYDFLTKYPHRVRILAQRLQWPNSVVDRLNHGLVMVAATSCKACRGSPKDCTAAPRSTRPGEEVSVAAVLD